MVKSIHFLMQIQYFSHQSLKPFANLKHIFRMPKIYVENTYNHLITSEKPSSWSPKHLLHVFLVHFVDHFADHLADKSFEHLIDCLISSSIIMDPLREIVYSSFYT